MDVRRVIVERQVLDTTKFNYSIHRHQSCSLTMRANERRAYASPSPVNAHVLDHLRALTVSSGLSFPWLHPIFASRTAASLLVDIRSKVLPVTFSLIIMQKTLAFLALVSAAVAIPTSAERFAARVARPRTARPTSCKMSRRAASRTRLTRATGPVPSGPRGTYTAVTGTFTVPTPTGNDGSASAWVGIDGSSCGNAILQTGVDFNIASGQVSYDAWYEWYPAASADFSNISINSGDVITVTVTATSTTAGTAVIENTTNGQSVTQQLTSSSALCEQDAEWIVEDFSVNGGLVAFANFGSVTFTGATATTGSGTVTPNGATIYDIQQNGQTLTTTTINGNDVTVAYT
ncbi:hypothetical protein CONPUDRAFT_166706 [Coniophora puteana RWD-64-598 SS2]|uniref:Acid proteinase n=1 Tax=Coniophora puteana (strain RWD-64-598) TaxID=741705 RepID=A0A5M3MJ19_CONPW|nr:uncharacterized protein CONPUDRAFT_166706 [Coniophora puteana RWD-64-598 SS2]EIW78784.1 hypothetical protein CONPUDRAFT_166706 [Coniophora puteana RWD-64-598 SS2]